MYPKLIFWITLFLFGCAYNVEGQIPTTSQLDIVIIHSYDSTRVEVQRMDSGIRNALIDEQRFPISFRLESHYMGANTLYTQPKQMRSVAQSLLVRIQRLKPRLVILSDPVAVQVLGPYVRQYTDSPILAVGAALPGAPAKSQQLPVFPSKALYQSLPLSQNVQLWDSILANRSKRKGLVITGPYRFDQVYRQIKQKNEESSDQSVKWEIKRVSTWKEFQAAVRWANYREDIDLIYPQVELLPWAGDASLHISQMTDWISTYANKPVIGTSLHTVALGLSGGIVQNHNLMGHETGRVAARLLRGESPDQQELSEVSANTMSFNIQALRKLDIHVSPALLTAAEYVFEEVEVQ